MVLNSEFLTTAVHMNATVIMLESQQWIHGNIVHMFIQAFLQTQCGKINETALTDLPSLCWDSGSPCWISDPRMLLMHWFCRCILPHGQKAGYWRYVLSFNLFLSRRKIVRQTKDVVRIQSWRIWAFFVITCQLELYLPLADVIECTYVQVPLAGYVYSWTL